MGLTEFGELLLENGARAEFGDILSRLKEMGPSEIDAELRSLDVPCCTSGQEDERDDFLNDGRTGRPLLVLYFLQAVEQGLATKRDYELLVSYLALCLRMHMQLILRHADLMQACERLSGTLTDSWDEVDSKFNMCLCILNYLRSLVS